MEKGTLSKGGVEEEEQTKPNKRRGEEKTASESPRAQSKFLVIHGLKHLDRDVFVVFTEMQCTETQKKLCFTTTIILLALPCFLRDSVYFGAVYLKF